MIRMPACDAEQFDPPAPVALVTFRNVDANRIASQVLMLIDSGADATVVPEHILAQLDIDTSRSPRFEIVGIENRVQLAPAVSLELRFLGRTFRGSFLVAPGECGILGRNVLNRIPLLFDGPNLTWGEFRR